MIFTGERLHVDDIGGINEFRYRSALKYVKNKRVVELGCAFGYGSQIVAEGGAEKVIAYDADSQAIEYAKSHFADEKVKYRKAKIENIKLNDKFDTAISYEVIEHLEAPEQLLQLVKGILKKGGYFLISTPNRLKSSYDGDKPSNPYHVKEYYPNEFKELLEKYFKNVELYGIDLKKDKLKNEEDIKNNLRWKIASFLVRKRFIRRIINVLPASPKRLITGENKISFTYKDFRLSKRDINESPYLFAICEK